MSNFIDTSMFTYKTQLEIIPQWLIHPCAYVVTMVGYLGGIKLLTAYMRDRKPMKPQFAMRIYNVVQILLCGYMVIGMFHEFYKHAESVEVMPGIVLPRFLNIFGTNTPVSEVTEWMVFVHYLSKFLDLFDTVFIVLKKDTKRLNLLHVYHHATIGPIWGLLLWLGWGGGTAMFGAAINSLIHVIMYTHYLVTSFGIQNPFKKAVTACQITQFYFCLTHSAWVLSPIETVYPTALASIQFGYQTSMIILFTNFYEMSYKATNKDMMSPPSSPTKLNPGENESIRQRQKSGGWKTRRATAD